jgi:hypothetical protein
LTRAGPITCSAAIPPMCGKSSSQSSCNAAARARSTTKELHLLLNVACLQCPAPLLRVLESVRMEGHRISMNWALQCLQWVGLEHVFKPECF